MGNGLIGFKKRGGGNFLPFAELVSWTSVLDCRFQLVFLLGMRFPIVYMIHLIVLSSNGDVAYMISVARDGATWGKGEHGSVLSKKHFGRLRRTETPSRMSPKLQTRLGTFP